MSGNWTETVFRLLQEQLADGDVVSRAVSAGCPQAIAETLVAFLPLACGRVLLDGTGVVVSRKYRVMSPCGEVGEPRSLAADPHWIAIMNFVERQRVQAPAAVRVVGMRSAEFDAVNKAALNGSKLTDLVCADPIFLVMQTSVRSRDLQRPWWAFWRRSR